MSWTRAAWQEPNSEEELTIPTVWMEENEVCWPSGMNVLRACNEKWLPKSDWHRFPLIKIKVQSGK